MSRDCLLVKARLKRTVRLAENWLRRYRNYRGRKEDKECIKGRKWPKKAHGGIKGQERKTLPAIYIHPYFGQTFSVLGGPMFDLMQEHMIMQGKYMTGWIVSCNPGSKRAHFSSILRLRDNNSDVVSHQ